MNLHGPEKLPEAAPYKGMDSYRQEDSAIFFGRTGEGELIAAKILSSRFTVLHAQSGAGKTSLLHARVIPNLEASGASPVSIRLQQDPVESVRTSVLLSLLPPPTVELLTLDRMLSLGTFPEAGVTIGQTLDFFDRLPVWDPRRAKIIEPTNIDMAIPGAVTHATGVATSMFARLLRSTIELPRYTNHLEAIGGYAPYCLGKFRSMNVETPVASLIDLLQCKDFHDAYDKVLGALYIPQPELTIFFEQLTAIYGARVPDLSIILIFDQFEELFTLFVPALNSLSDPSKYQTKWKLRTEFLTQLRDLYIAAIPANIYDSFALVPKPSLTGLPAGLPLRLVLSMRDEYIAQLDPLRAFVLNLSDSTYHLGLLNQSQASEAITCPASQFKFKYSDNCLAEIVQDLTKEDGLIEPAHMQLVCERLWQKQGKQLSREGVALAAELENTQAAEITTPIGDGDLLPITVETFENLGRVPGILSTYLSGFLDKMLQPDQLESLEILEPLVTTSRTRNIVEKSILIHARYRDEQQRETLLNDMVDAKIVRVERRLGGSFVEIVHEFLIDGVLKEIRDRLLANPEYGKFRSALVDLYMATKQSQSYLVRRSFDTLHQNRARVVWDQDARVVMARSAVAHGMSRDECALWLSDISEASLSYVNQLLDSISIESDPLPMRELTTALSIKEVAKLRPEAKLVVLRALLYWSEDSQRENIRSWIKEADLYA